MMKKNLLFFILLVQLPFEIYCAVADIEDPYAHSQMVTIVRKYTKEDIACFLTVLQEEISEFLNSEKIDQKIQRQQVESEKARTLDFLHYKAESKRFDPDKEITRPFHKSVVMPLRMKLLKDKLYSKRKATVDKIEIILNIYEATQQLFVPLELLSEAIKNDEKVLASILKEEKDFYKALILSDRLAATANPLNLPLDPSSGLVHVPIPPLSPQTHDSPHKRTKR